MSFTDDEFTHQSLQDHESIVKYLEAISQGLKSGKLLFGTRNKKLTLEPCGLLTLAVKAKRKSRKVKLEIKITWATDKDEKDSTDNSLEIKAGKKEKK